MSWLQETYMLKIEIGKAQWILKKKAKREIMNVVGVDLEIRINMNVRRDRLW
jgi:hypothetical protein